MESSQDGSHARSGEEDEILRKSKKRFREKENTSDPLSFEVAMSSDAEQPLSFKEKLLGSSYAHMENETEDWFSEDGENQMEEDNDPVCPAIRIHKEENARLRKPWKTNS